MFKKSRKYALNLSLLSFVALVLGCMSIAISIFFLWNGVTRAKESQSALNVYTYLATEICLYF